ncbi:hypothetical protein RDV64_22330 [Acuticoccus sp. MNP-M23]|uniref:hypothetical protein n=1 Tax=Acuticoccus sp. MNP-M23 TaxID=3072793 RepID=UPI0028158410|nr:hypothetical protein [Acuticoccus sp. MNP-M23]WMS42758.1 hypothetical protein RDV64_22330 [Acuticoccus sp. MNP-M23]
MTKPLLPDIYQTQKYRPLNSNNDVVWVGAGDNGCTGCHGIGAVAEGNGYRIGRVNALASGTSQSLRARRPSPTQSTYDDFMVGKIRDVISNDCISGGDDRCEAWRRGIARAELAALTACAANPASSGCEIKEPPLVPPHPGNGLSARTYDGRPADPTSMQGLHLMKRYSLQTDGWCLSPVDATIADGTQVKQVLCEETRNNNSKNWLYDKDSGLIRSAQHAGKCLALKPKYIDRTRHVSSDEFFRGAERNYHYGSKLILQTCGNRGPHNDIEMAWVVSGQKIRLKNRSGTCLSGDWNYSRFGRKVTDAYGERCSAQGNGSFWVLTKALTIADAL